VYSGLLLAARDEAQLAAALAHELGHMARRDLERLTAAGRSQEEIAVDLVRGDAAVSHTVADEEQADRIALRALFLTGYDPLALGELRRQVSALDRQSPLAVRAFLADHPPPPRDDEELAPMLRAFGNPRGERGERRLAEVRARLRSYYASL